VQLQESGGFIPDPSVEDPDPSDPCFLGPPGSRSGSATLPDPTLKSKLSRVNKTAKFFFMYRKLGKERESAFVIAIFLGEETDHLIAKFSELVLVITSK
jgi:hypothetical protein